MTREKKTLVEIRLTSDDSRLNRFELLDLTTIKIRTSWGSTYTRRYYTDSNFEGTFTANGVKYIIPNIRTAVYTRNPEVKGNPIVIPVTQRSGSVPTPVPTPDEPVPTPDEPVLHPQASKIRACIKHDIPVYLVGPAGTGKSYTLKVLATELGLDFYSTNAIQDVYTGLKGFIDANGTYHETEFYKAFVNGGVFLIDEMDASIPEALTTINTAIANRYFEFPNGRVEAHENFRIVAAGNTYGNGADELYTGRMVLDSASLDRFTVIDFDYDSRVELTIARGDQSLVDFIQEIREACKKGGIRGTFSMRMIHNVIQLQADLDLTDVIQIAVVKGMDKDTLRSITLLKGGKYRDAFYKLRAA